MPPAAVTQLMDLHVKNITCNSLDVDVCVENIDFSVAGAVLVLVLDSDGEETLGGAVVEVAATGDSFLVQYDIHFLPPDSSVLVTAMGMKRNPVSEKWVMLPDIASSPRQLPVQLPAVPGNSRVHLRQFDGRGYVGPEHKPGLWILKAPCDGQLWTDCLEPEFLARLFSAALFVLPVRLAGSLGVIVSPENRYCIDFRLRRQAPSNYRRFIDRRCRKVLRTCCIRVNQDYVGCLRVAAAVHTEERGSTWISEPLIHALDRLRLMSSTPRISDGQPEPVPQMKTVELRDRSSNELKAVVCGFAMGAVFHEFTTATVVKGPDGYGTALTKLLLHSLNELGFDLDYWGYKLDYFFNYDVYGGVEVGVDEFWPRWTANRSNQTVQSSLDRFLESL